MADIPLFPLGVVLFPNMPLALHIFEERYREMIRDCEASGQGFGVVGIQPSRDGRGGHIYNVGTLANLREVEHLEDGRFNLTVTGATRFRIRALSLEKSYITASVDLLPDVDDPPEVVTPLARQARELFTRYSAALRTVTTRADEAVDIPENPEILSYVVASALQVETWQQQALLDMDSVAARLRQCIRLMRRELVFAERMLARFDTRHAVAAIKRN